ncbi:MAG: hypothetical protein ACJAYG_002778 [Oceanicoccus sp.]|jgi:hypothetical protein
MRSVLILVLSFLPLLSICEELGALDGSIHLGGKHSDYLQPTQGNSHLYINLEGEVARNLFEKLPGQAIHDECTGYDLKRGYNSSVVCAKAKNDTYSCSFSINMENNATEIGMDGCI